jgi:hypothetical protein
MLKGSIDECVAMLEHPAPEGWAERVPRVVDRLACLSHDLLILGSWVQITPDDRFEFVERFPSAPPVNSWSGPEGVNMDVSILGQEGEQE